MRRLIRATGIAAATSLFVLGVAGATDRGDQQPESRAYVGFSFGGDQPAARTLRNFHYGLRLDHDSRFNESDAVLPPLIQFDFTRRGLSDARLNGLSVLKQSYKLAQAEEPATEEPPAEQSAESAPAEPAPAEAPPAEAAPAEEGAAAAGGGESAAEEPGFFGRMWNGVKGIFGGGDETETAEAPPAEAPAQAAAGDEAAPAGEAAAEGAFSTFGIVDWGLLALGVAGVGLAASEVSNGDEDPDPPGGVQSGGGTTGGTTGGTGCTFFPTTTTCIPSTLTSGPGRWSTPYERPDPEHEKWLDGGTGQMGDLGG